MTDNVSSKSTNSVDDHPQPNLYELLTQFNQDSTTGLKHLKQELLEMNKKISIKDLRTKLEQTKKNLVDICQNKEKIL